MVADRLYQLRQSEFKSGHLRWPGRRSWLSCRSVVPCLKDDRQRRPGDVDRHRRIVSDGGAKYGPAGIGLPDRGPDACGLVWIQGFPLGLPQLSYDSWIGCCRLGARSYLCGLKLSPLFCKLSGCFEMGMLKLLDTALSETAPLLDLALVQFALWVRLQDCRSVLA